MRVIAGIARGRKLVPLEGEAVRPTPDRVKESLFNILQFDIEGKCFLDLFAGTGQIGIEAISRGAQKTVFVDASRKSIQVISQNIAAAGFQSQSEVVNADSLMYIRRAAVRFDVAFLDPPYRSGLLQEALPLVAEAMNEDGIIICEHPTDEEVPDSLGAFRRVKDYRYGKILLTSYKKDA